MEQDPRDKTPDAFNGEYWPGEFKPKKLYENFGQEEGNILVGKQKRDALVFIGRMQPFHNGHKAVIDKALEQAKQVVVVLGSAFSARNSRNPFTFEERKAMIESIYGNRMIQIKRQNGDEMQYVSVPKVLIVPVSDYPYDDNKWINAVQKAVDEAVPHAKDIGLIGHSKDSTSYYLNIFREWKDHVEVENVYGINATDIREQILTPMDYTDFEELEYVMPSEIISVMAGFLNKPELKVVRAEHEMIRKYKTAWKAAPFPPTFMTVDAVVVQSGHILLVKRGDMPGKGLWALPGGFLNQEETMLDGAIRELKEETKIKVPVPVLKGSIKESKTFDAPNRSARGRTITQAFFIDLGVGELPRVKGSDDAEKAFWVPFSKLKQENFFEDHYHIISHFLKIG